MSTPRPELRLSAILHGGDYNPDQWPEAVWDDDVRLMQLAQVNIATLPVFGWAALNPAEGVYTFDWLDRVIGKLHAGGVGLCLATATGSTPAWLDQQYPDVRITDENGVHRLHAGRHSFCPTSTNFRRAAGDLVRAIAQRYGAHPGLRLWHVGNEYGGTWPSNYCYCQRCTEAFRAWLLDRYGSLGALNDAWSLAFWGHQYSSWSQVEAPFTIGERGVQAHLLDWRRFHTRQLLDCYRTEAAILREVSPAVPITTNLMGAFFPQDYHVWAKELDVISWDSYPSLDTPWSHTAFNHALMRGLKHGQPFLLMEQSPSQQNWMPHNRVKPPGRLRIQSLQAIANGAESVMYFQWRRSRGGIEKLHGAVVEHHGRSDARVFREVAALGADLKALGDRTLGGRIQARAAVLFDWESWWAQSASSGLSSQLSTQHEATAHYAALHEAGIATDVVDVDADLSTYDLIVAPALYLLRAEHARRIAERVAAGATLVTTFASGMVDACDRIHAGGPPGPLAEVLGLRVEEWDGLTPELRNGVRFTRQVGPANRGGGGGIPAKHECPSRMLCTRVWLEGAQAVATYTSEFYAGEPAITVHPYGKGQAWYLGTRLEDAGLARLLTGIAAERGLASPLAGGAPPPPDVEVSERISPTTGQRILYLLNHGPEPREAVLPEGRFTDLLTGQACQGRVALAARGALVLAR